VGGGLGPIDSRIDLVALAMQHDAQEFAQALLVIDNQNPVFFKIG
jgi:hypothetical protein